MPAPVSAAFFSEHPVFSRTEYAAAIRRTDGDPTVSSMLAHHLRAGNIKRVTRGVFASVPPHADAGKWVPDLYQVAAVLRGGDCVVGYHSALDLHGCVYSAWPSGLQVIAPGRPGWQRLPDFHCWFIRPPRGFAPPDGVQMVNHLGMDVRVTTLERTVADIFARPNLAGGREELFQSVKLIERLDLADTVRHMRALGNAAAAGALGFWLESMRGTLDFSEKALRELRSLAPKRPRYAMGAKPGAGRATRGWNVILPVDLIAPSYEEFL